MAEADSEVGARVRVGAGVAVQAGAAAEPNCRAAGAGGDVLDVGVRKESTLEGATGFTGSKVQKKIS